MSNIATTIAITIFIATIMTNIAGEVTNNTSAKHSKNAITTTVPTYSKKFKINFTLSPLHIHSVVFYNILNCT